MIFGAAGVLNLTNTIITTILARRREFATMQSIGMTAKQLTRMMIWESVYYAAGACASGLILSVILAFTVVRGLTGNIWYFTFHFTLLPALTACVVLLIVAAIVPVIALKVFNEGSIVLKNCALRNNRTSRIELSATDIILQAKNLKKYYGKGETEVRALDGINLEIETG